MEQFKLFKNVMLTFFSVLFLPHKIMLAHKEKKHFNYTLYLKSNKLYCV